MSNIIKEQAIDQSACGYFEQLACKLKMEWEEGLWLSEKKIELKRDELKPKHNKCHMLGDPYWYD